MATSPELVRWEIERVQLQDIRRTGRTEAREAEDYLLLEAVARKLSVCNSGL
jgi:hypothetical protein